VLAVVMLGLPYVVPFSVADLGVKIALYALAAVGLSLLMGLAGQVSLGNAGFFAIGGFTAGILVTRYSWPLSLATVAAVLMASVVALAVGLPLLRLRGHFLALATLGFGIVVQRVSTQLDLTGRTDGIQDIPYPDFGGRVYDEPAEQLALLAPVLLLCVLLARNLVCSRVGRALGAVSDSEVAAGSLGVDTFRLRLQVLVISAAYAGLGGALYGFFFFQVSGEQARFSLSVEFLLMAVLGGLGSVWGGVVGAGAIEGLRYWLERALADVVPAAAAEAALLGFGLVLVLLVLALPGGIGQAWGWLLRAARRALAGRRPGHAPSAASGPVDGVGPEGGPAGPEPTDTSPLLVREGRPAPGSLLLEVEGLTKRFGGVTAVDGVSLTVHAGEIVGLIGPNGAGKTTTFNMVTGVVTPTGGTIRLAGREVQGRPSHVIAAAGATRTFQNLQIFRSMTVVQNVMVGRHLRSRAGVLRAALSLPARSEERAIEASARGLVELLGLAEVADQPAADLPFGTQRLVEIARALAAEPDLLLLDEPMAGLSAAERRRLVGLLRRLRAGGTAIVIVEHDVDAVLALADRVAVLDDGRLCAFGDPETVRRDPAVIAAYLGVEPDDVPEEASEAAGAAEAAGAGAAGGGAAAAGAPRGGSAS